jgi:hypothetical protein
MASYLVVVSLIIRWSLRNHLVKEILIFSPRKIEELLGRGWERKRLGDGLSTLPRRTCKPAPVHRSSFLGRDSIPNVTNLIYHIDEFNPKS